MQRRKFTPAPEVGVPNEGRGGARKALRLVTPEASSLSAYTALMVDPLNAPPVGKPDQNAVATNVARFRDVVQVTSDANGYAYARVNAGVNDSHFTTPTITTGAVTTWGTATPSNYYTSINTDNRYYRTLCYVVEWQPTLSEHAAAGRIFMGKYNSPALAALTDYFDDEGLTATAAKPMISVARPTGDLYPTVPSAPMGLANMQSTVVIMSGLPTAVLVGQLVITRVLELYPDGAVLARMTATHTPCDMVDCCVAANVIGPGVDYSSGEDAYTKLVRNGTKIAKVAVRLYKAYSTGGASELARMFG